MSESAIPTSAMASQPGRWQLALGADGETAAAALRELAACYWYCIYAWWRRTGLERAAAAEATVRSFGRWLAETPPTADDPESLRLREWIPARLAEFGEAPPATTADFDFVIDLEQAEAQYALEPEADARATFERRWALTLLAMAEGALKQEYLERGEEALYEALLPFAGFEPSGDERYESAGDAVGFSASAMRKAVFDFRTRQRELVRAYIADTVADPAEVESEMTALLIACDAAGSAAATAQLPTVLRSVQPDQVIARAMQSVKMSGIGGAAWEPPDLAEVSGLFPQYEITKLLGRGGMGAVYRGRQVALDRPVAVKLLPLEVSADEDFAERFRREARAMAKLSHPHIIAVHDFGTTSEGHLYFVMEYVEGANLHEIIHGPGLSAEQALAISGQVCTALAYAHSRGVVHRDIKPANVMVDVEGNAKVADFGLARLTDPSSDAWATTMTGTVMGTPDYMAPEQKRGMHVDHRADIYSLGVMLYEMLCGETPQGIFEPPSQRVGCDSRIDQIVIRAMQQAPEKRYQSTQDMKSEVEAVRTPLPTVSSLVATPPPAGVVNGNGATAHASERKKSRLVRYLAIAGAVLVGVPAVLLLLYTFQSSPASRPRPTINPETSNATPSFAPRNSELGAGEWKPLFSEEEWRRTDVPDHTHEFKDGLLHVTRSAQKKLDRSDGAIRARFVLRPDESASAVFAHGTAQDGEYKLVLNNSRLFVTLEYFASRTQSTFLGKYMFPTPPKIGDELTLELRVQGSHFVGIINGVGKIEADDQQLPERPIWGVRGNPTWVASVEVQPLPPPGPAAAPAPTAHESAAVKLWDTAAKLPNDSHLQWKDGAIVMTGSRSLTGGPVSRDAIVRGAIRKTSSRSDARLGLRCAFPPTRDNSQYYALQVVFEYNFVQLRCFSGSENLYLTSFKLPRTYADGEWMHLELKAVGNELTVSAEGQTLGNFRDGKLTAAGNAIIAASVSGPAPDEFRDVEYVPLQPPSAASPAASANPIRLWATADEVPKLPGVRFENGEVVLGDSPQPRGIKDDRIDSRDCILRAQVQMNSSDQWPKLIVRRSDAGNYDLLIESKEKLAYLASVAPDGTPSAVKKWSLPRQYEDGAWIEVELQAVGDDITVRVDGQSLGTVHDTSHQHSGAPSIFGRSGARFRNIVFAPLDPGASK